MIRTTSRKPVSVSIENITPALARSERTIRCTPTERATCDVVEALVGPVADRPVGEQRGDSSAGPHRAACGVAVDVEEGLLLAGEAGVGQVLGRRAAADGHVAIWPELFLEPTISGLNGVRQFGGQGCDQNG